MRKFTNNFGCEMSFDDDIPDEQIQERLSWVGSNFTELKDRNQINLEETIEDIIHNNCTGCKHFAEDLSSSPCWCEPIRQVIDRECMVQHKEDENNCAKIWEKIRDKILGGKTKE